MKANNPLAKAVAKANLKLKKYHYHNGVKVFDLPKPEPTYLIKHEFNLEFGDTMVFTQKLTRIDPPIGHYCMSSRNQKYMVGVNGNLLRVV